MVINTLNESSLHKTLKTLFSLEDGSRTEVQENGYVFDIVNKDGSIVEIQTKNLSALQKKASDALEQEKNFTVIHPIVVQNTIITQNSEGIPLSKRKSPNHKTIHHVFMELTRIYPLLLDKNFTLKILFVNTIEKRIRTEVPVQSKNKRRRFKKNWNKSDTILEEILEEKTLKTADDYIALIPQELCETFTANDIAEKLKKIPHAKKNAKKLSGIMVWVLFRMKILECAGTKNRSKLYRINGASISRNSPSDAR